MFSYIWHTFFFDPIYNLLVFSVNTVRDGDLGLAVIVTVIVVKVILLPLSIRAAKTQKVMREIEPKIRALKEEYKDNKEVQVKAIMAVYKEAGMNPLAVLFNILLQFPILIALYLSIYSNYEANGETATFVFDPTPLYSFVPFPEVLSTSFLGMFDMLERNVFLALLAGITAYFQVKLTMPALPPADPDKTPDFKDEFMRNMQTQMRYVLPVLMVGIGYYFSAVIALYLVVTNLTAIAQEFYVRRHR